MGNRAVIFIVSDTDEKNFPIDEADLQARLNEVKAGLPKQGDNINSFIIPAFTLFKDCGLITKDNVELLNDAQWCNSTFRVKMNPLGGVLRKKGLTMWDKTNLRYNCPYNELIFQSDIKAANTPNKKGQSRVKGASKLAVICEGTTYYISNDWFADTTSRPTKRAFYNFLERETTKVCNLKWKKKLQPKEFYSPVKDFEYKLNNGKDGIYITKYIGTDTEVVIPPKINDLPVIAISVGNYFDGAFKGCTNLSSIVIPKSVKTIGDWAFQGCTGLQSIAIPEGVTTIKCWTFSGCTSLTSITIPESVTSIDDYTFEDCTGLTSIVIPNSVNTIGDFAFKDCKSLTSIDIPEGVNYIGESAFEGCTGLTSIKIPDSVTEIGDCAFSGCFNLSIFNSFSKRFFKYKNFICEIINSERISIISCLFADSNLDIPEMIENLPVTTIGKWAFKDCISLKSIVIPNSVKTIGDWAFSGCTSLTSITIPESVTSIDDYAFSYCTGLQNIVIPEGVNTIGESAFVGCTGLQSIVIPESVTEIGDCAFSGCFNLSIFNSFSKRFFKYKNFICERIKSEYISIIFCFFSDTHLVIPEMIENLPVTTIGKWAFKDCISLKSIVIPNSVKTIGRGAFSGCTSLTSIVIPNSVKTIGESAFSVCSGLQSIVIPEGVTYIGRGAFYGCTNLTSITIPESVTSIDDYAFAYCTGLQNIVIPEGVKTIGEYAFEGCKSLTSIVIPESVTNIDDSAFYRCNNLKWVYIKKSDWTVKDIINIFGTKPKFKFFRTQQELDEFLSSAENPDEWKNFWR